MSPQAWQNYFKKLLSLPKGARFKDFTRGIAETVFPAFAGLFKRKKDHNSADAALLAKYGAVHFESLCARRGLPA